MNDNAKKQVPLRLSPKLYAAIAAWAEDDFRSVNGQECGKNSFLSAFLLFIPFRNSHLFKLY